MPTGAQTASCPRTAPPLPLVHKLAKAGGAPRRSWPASTITPASASASKPKADVGLARLARHIKQERFHEHDADQMDEEGGPDVRDVVEKLANTPAYAPSEHLMCPLLHEVMSDPVFAEDGFTYERSAIEDWIRRLLPPDRANDDVPVTGPNGDAISIAALRPNRFVQMAVERWQRRRKAMEALVTGADESMVARRLRSRLEQIHALQRNHFEKAQQLGQIELDLREVQRKEHEAGSAVAAKEELIAEKEARMCTIEAQLHELSRELEELRAIRGAEKQQLAPLQQEVDALRNQTSLLQHSGAALFCEAEEARAELNNVWAQSIACRAQLQEAKELTNEVQKVIEEHPEAAAGLRHKLELSAGDLGHLRQEIDDIQQQIAKELCRCSRVIAEEDPSRVEMLSRARALGSREARYLLGKYYMRCTDPGLKAKAYSYLTRIAEPNAEQDEWATKAMYQLGLCHLYGIHTQADPSLAFCYFCNAADRGHARAQNMAGSFYDGIMSPAMPRDVELALGYFHKSAAQGYRPAQYNLAVLLLSDQARDEPKAFALFKELAESGEKESMLKLSWCYEEGRGVRKDCEAARHWRERALAVK